MSNLPDFGLREYLSDLSQTVQIAETLLNEFVDDVDLSIWVEDVLRGLQDGRVKPQEKIDPLLGIS